MSKTKSPLLPWQRENMLLSSDERKLIELLREAGQTCEAQRKAWREMSASRKTLEQFFRDEYQVQLQFDPRLSFEN